MTAKGGSSGFWGTSYILLQPYLKRFDRYFAELDPELSKAGLRITYKAYVAGMVARLDRRGPSAEPSRGSSPRRTCTPSCSSASRCPSGSPCSEAR